MNPESKQQSRVIDVLSFLLAVSAALHGNWSTQEACWSFWIAGLVSSWFLLVWGGVRLILEVVRGDQRLLAAWKVALQRVMPSLSGTAINFLFVASAALGGYILFYLYCYLFGFYGLFLSVFARMEPAVYFGPNGFINSDFFTPAFYLLSLYWPMVLSTLLWESPYLLRESPLKILTRPFHTRIVRLHFAIVGMPFVSLLAWALLGSSYHVISVAFVYAVFYLTPSKRSDELNSDRTPGESPSDSPVNN